jgi:small subunit ribosomal protein S1
LDIDKENRRLSLGHKQMEEDPWDTFETIFFEGALHDGTILSIEDKGAVIALPYGVEAFAPKKHLAKQDKSRLKVDELINVKVIEFDKANKKIIVSHTDIWKEEERKSKEKDDTDAKEKDARTKKDLKKVNKQSGDKGTLADELDILAQLKTKMEAEDRVNQQKAMADLDAKLAAKEDETEVAEETTEVVAETKAENSTEETTSAE